MTEEAESKTISLTIVPDLRADVDSEEVKVIISQTTLLKVAAGGRTIREDRDSREGSMPLPIWMFQDEEALRDFWKRVRGTFYETLPETLMLAAADHVQLITQYILAETHPEEIALKEYIDERANYRKRELKRILKLSVVGNFSAWSRTELARAVRSAIVRLKKDLSSKVTLDTVADKLKETHGEIAPKNGEALGALLKRNKLDWMKIKNR